MCFTYSVGSGIRTLKKEGFTHAGIYPFIVIILVYPVPLAAENF